MASLTIRDLEERVKHRLRLQAARHGRSMEEEARTILRAALADRGSEPPNLYAAVRRHIEPLGGVDLDIPAREKSREPPRFDR